MSLFKSFKKALGFPEDYNNDLGDLSDLEDRDDDVTNSGDNETSSEPETSSSVQNKLISDSYILSLATEIVNSVAPESSDNEILISSVSTTLSKHIPMIAERGKQEAERKYLKERIPLIRELNELKKQISDKDSQTERSANVLLNPLKKQIDDLQKQVLNLEAEREQLQLENKYMAERIRGSMPENIIAQTDSDSDYKQLLEENIKLKKEISNLNTQLQNTLSVEEQESFKQSFEQQVEKFEEILTKKETELKKLRVDKSELTSECQKLASRVAIDDEKIDSLEKKVAELHKTIQTNLFDHATEQDKLNREIKRLSVMISEPEKQQKVPRKTKTKDNNITKTESAQTTTDSLAIDELMDSTEWFTAPEPGPRIKDPEVTENFGYKETVRKKTQKYDENQLTLF